MPDQPMELDDFFDEVNKPKVERRPWMNEKVMELVTAETIDRVVDECIAAGLYAWDVETTGLDSRVFYGDEGTPTTVDKIVGHCLSPDGVRGYYAPVRHVDAKGNPHEANIPLPIANAALKRLAESKAVAVFHHSKFDTEMLQFGEPGCPLGEWDDPEKFEDTYVEAYVRNTRERKKGLKILTLQELHYEMIELEDLFTEDQIEKSGGKLNFAMLDPTWAPALWYGCSDAICTFLLHKGEKKFPGFHAQIMDPEPTGLNQKVTYKLEKMCLPATRWMERNRIHVNREKVEELIRLGQVEWFDSLESVYAEASRIVGRDVRPGWYRLMRGLADIPAADHYKFDPAQTKPDYMAVREDAKKGSSQHKLDPTEVGAGGKERIRTITKETPTLLDPRKKEPVAFPMVYDVTIPAELGLMLRELGVKGLKATDKSGQVKTSAEEIDRVLEEAGDQFPFMKKVRRFRETAKALGSNLFPILNDSIRKRAPDGCIRVNFDGHKTDTGRFATPQPRDKTFHGQVRWNLHSIPATYIKDRPECMLHIRECVAARPGKILVACVAEGTLIQTGRGLIPIENVRVGDTVITETGQCKVTGAVCNGVRDTVEIRTELGFSAKYTDDHLVLTVDDDGFGWKPAGEMVPGDWVCLVAGQPTHADWPSLPLLGPAHGNTGPVRVPPVLSTGLAEFFGRLMGDGCITGSMSRGITTFSIALGGDAGVLTHGIQESVEGWFGMTNGRLDDDGTLVYASRPIARWLNVVLDKGDVHNLRVPDIVLSAPVEAHRAFLRGLFDADGSVGTRDEDGVSIWITSETMSRQVQLLLLQDGILTRRVWCQRITNYGVQEGWRLTVNGIRSLARFRSRVGFVTPRKQEALREIKRAWQSTDFVPLSLAKKAIIKQSRGTPNAALRNGKRKGRVTPEALERCVGYPRSIDREWLDRLVHGTLRFDRVDVRVTAVPAAVYDLTVPEVGLFSAGGLVVHNCDYSGVELRIVTNLAGEPKWLVEFFRCSQCDTKFDRTEIPPSFCPKCGSDKIGDLHTLTAISVYGDGILKDPDVLKEKRQSSKSLNFAMCYGGGGQAAMRAVDVDQDEGWRIKRQFDASYPTLRDWWERQHRFAHKYKFVTTAFGRRYPLPDIDHEMKGFVEKAKRNAVNGPVQGTSADITKLAMALVYLLCKERGWLRRVLMTITIHDELVFEIDEAIAEEAVDLIVETMTRNKFIQRLKHVVPYKCDVEFGTDWSVPFNLTKMANNKGGGKWTVHLTAVFPKAYASYLTCGGAPVEGAAPPVPQSPPTDDKAAAPTPAPESEGTSPSKPLFKVPETGKGVVCTHVVHRSQLNMGLMIRLAEVIHKVEGRGLETLRVVTEDGLVLYDDPKTLISATEFKVLADEHHV